MAITFNPAKKSARITLSNGNLTATTNTTGNWQSVGCTVSKTAGKWYAEFSIANTGAGVFIGIAKDAYDPTATGPADPNNFVGDDANGFSYLNAAQKFTNGSGVAYGASWTSATIAVAMDLDAGQVTFYLNNATQGIAFTGLSGSFTFYISAIGGGSPNTVAVTAAFDAASFAFTPPAGFSALTDTTPPPHFNGAATMQSLTCDGERQAAGVFVMQPLQAAGGHNPKAACQMQPLQATGAGGARFGDCDMQSFTAAATGFSDSTGTAVMEDFTASGNGTVGSLIIGAGEIPSATLLGSGITGAAYSASLIVPALTLSAGFEATADLDVSTLFLTAQSVQGNVSEAAAILPVPILQGVSLAGSAIHGNLLGRAPKLQGVMVSETLGLLIETLRPMYLTATMLNGNAGFLSEIVPALILSSVGFGPYIGTGSMVITPSLFLEGQGLSELADNFRTWVLNVRKKGLTEYSNFHFNSYAEYRDTVLSAGDAGIMKLSTVNKDLAANIDATVRTGAESFGTSYNKRVPRIYAGYSSTGDLHFATYTSQDGKRLYLLPWNNITGVQQRRVPVGRGPKSPYWQFEVSNVEGADFLLEHLQVYPEKTTRRVV